MNLYNDVIIAGGGLAGLTAAIHLAKAGFKVTVFEKTPYPHHKVCGEYISNEVVPYLQSLGAYPANLQPTQISKFQFSCSSGKMVAATLPLGGFGISRYAFDHFLMQKAVGSGCEVIQDTVLNINLKGHLFEVRTAFHGISKSPVVLAAYGKRTALDHKLNRPFIQKTSPWLAVKAHYTGDFANDLVALHHFKGGYCGVSKVENDRINICYLTDYASFRNYRSLEQFQRQVLYQNKHLREVFENSSPAFESPISIGQISFDSKEATKDHILMIGDAAGLIHPLCGNGMSMAIHSAKICAEQVIQYLSIHNFTRENMEQNYSRLWKHHFNERLYTGRILSALLQKEKLAALMTSGLANFPFILPQLIKRTHGYQL